MRFKPTVLRPLVNQSVNGVGDIFNASFFKGAGGLHLHGVTAGVRWKETQRLLVLTCGLAGKGPVIAVVLIDDQEVGHFHDASLDALQFIASTREHQEEECIGQIPNSGFRLAHTDGFDNDTVKTCRLAQQDGFVGAARDTAEVGGRRARPNKGGGLLG